MAFLLATMGLSAVGTLFSALTVQIRAREVMLPILLLPLVIPVMIAAVEATKGALNGDPLTMYSQWLELLAIFDVIFSKNIISCSIIAKNANFCRFSCIFNYFRHYWAGNNNFAKNTIKKWIQE